jgi:hypothetical protein
MRREAKKMYRKSPYLHHLPLLLFSLNAWFELFIETSRYGKNAVRHDFLRPLDELRE